jgi:hypothetical protein
MKSKFTLNEMNNFITNSPTKQLKKRINELILKVKNLNSSSDFSTSQVLKNYTKV